MAYKNVDNPLADELDVYAPFHLARADMLQRMGKLDQAREAYRRALDLSQNQVERAFIGEQIKRLEGDT